MRESTIENGKAAHALVGLLLKANAAWLATVDC